MDRACNFSFSVAISFSLLKVQKLMIYSRKTKIKVKSTGEQISGKLLHTDNQMQTMC